MRRAFANSRNIRIPPVPQSGGAPPPGPGIVTDNLVLNLDAGDAASYPGTGTTWTDLVTGTQTFTFNSTPAYNGSIGYFNFQANNASGTTSINPTRGAVELWFRWKTSSPISVGIMFTGGVNWTAVGNLTGTLPDESLEFYTGVSAAMDYRNGHNYYKDGEWHQMVAVIDGAANQLYVDGAPVTTYFRTGNAASTGLMNLANVIIGKYSSGYQFDGDIAVVRVYDTGADSFSADDVLQNYDAQSARFAAFEPSTISSLTLWLDPDDANTVTTGGSSEVLSIRDKAHAVDRVTFEAPSASPTGPQLVSDGGRNWLQFNPTGVVDSLVGYYGAGSYGLPRSAIMTGNVYETHVVFKPTSTPSQSSSNPWQNNGLGPSDASGYWGIYMQDDGAGNTQVVPYNYSSHSTYNRYPVTVGDKHIVGHSKSAGTSNLYNYLDGVSTTVGSFGSSLGGSSGIVEIGVGSANYKFSGLVGEVCHFNAELSTTDRDNLIAYLKAKWSIT
jgi:hypothetical protein